MEEFRAEEHRKLHEKLDEAKAKREKANKFMED